MTDKELRHLSKLDLIEIIYQMKKTEEQLKAELKTANERLQCRDINFQEAGSIAEAALGLNGVFEAAQRAADDYLAQIHKNNEEAERRCAERIAETDAECQRKCEATDKEIEEKWHNFNEKVQQLLKAHAELSALLK